MTSGKKKRLSRGKSQEVLDNKVDDDGNGPLVEGGARNGTRSASEAFGDDCDQCAESPAQKKQNTATSTPEDQASQKPRSFARTSTNNGNKRSGNGYSKDPDVGLGSGGANDANGTLSDCSIGEKKENVLDIAPPTMSANTKTAAVATKVAKKMVLKSSLSTPRDLKCDALETLAGGEASADDHHTRSFDSKNGRTWIENLGWFAVFSFINLFVLSGVIYTGILLSERTSYQLESLECQQRLHQTYEAIGLRIGFEDLADDDEEDYIRDSFEEQKQNYRELEKQALYWKKEAEMFERKGEVFREQCQQNYQNLLSELDPDRREN